MEPDERELRRLWAAPSAQPVGGHPDEEAWIRLATGEVTSGERAELFAHAGACAECAAVYRGLEGFREAALRAPGAPRRSLAANRGWLLAAAAALVALVAAPLLLRAPLERQPIPATHGEQPDTLRGAPGSRPQAVSPVGRLATSPRQLRWQAAGAPTHQVEILAGDGTLLWRSPEVTGSSLALPPELDLRPGRYYWRVIAFSAPGAPPNPSRLRAFEITP